MRFVLFYWVNSEEKVTEFQKQDLLSRLIHIHITLKGTVSRDFLLLVFFMNQFPPHSQSIPLGQFRIFSEIRGDIRK